MNLKEVVRIGGMVLSILVGILLLEFIKGASEALDHGLVREETEADAVVLPLSDSSAIVADDSATVWIKPPAGGPNHTKPDSIIDPADIHPRTRGQKMA